MAKKENTILVIDVGSFSLKMAEFRYPMSGGMVLERFDYAKMPEVESGDAIEAYALCCREMLKKNAFVSRNVRVSLSGQASFSRVSKMPKIEENTDGVAKIVEYEARNTVPYPLDEVLWDYQLIRYEDTVERTVEPEENATPGEGEPPAEPQVVTEKVDQFEALFVAVKSDLVMAVTDVLLDAGKDIESVEVAPVAMFNAAKAVNVGVEQCELILNIGGRGSSLVFVDGARIFMRSIPIAGDSITTQVAKEYAIPFQDAEELKLRHGFVALGGAYEEPESEVAATISKIARNVMTRLHGEINRSINAWRSSYGGNRPVCLWLTGGGTLMPYMTEFFIEKLHLDVQFLNVFPVVTLGEKIDREQLSSFATMFPEQIGMGLRGMVRCPIEISLMPPSILSQKELNRKKPYFYISVGSLILCLLIFTWGVSRRAAFDRQRVLKTQEAVDQTNKLVERVKKLGAEIGGPKGDFTEAYSRISGRYQWVRMLEELQNIIPNTMWITRIEGVGTPLAPTAQTMDSGGGGLFDEPKKVAMPKAAATNEDFSEIKELRVFAHALMLQNVLFEEELKKNLKDAKFFANGDDAIVYEPGTVGARGTNNLATFVMRIKLKNPITF